MNNSKLKPSMFIHLFITIIFGGGVRKRTGLANFALLSINDKKYRKRGMKCGQSDFSLLGVRAYIWILFYETKAKLLRTDYFFYSNCPWYQLTLKREN